MDKHWDCKLVVASVFRDRLRRLEGYTEDHSKGQQMRPTNKLKNGNPLPLILNLPNPPHPNIEYSHNVVHYNMSGVFNVGGVGV